MKGSSPSYSTIEQWVSKLKKGRTSTSDEPRSGRLFDVATPEIIEKINKMVIEDYRLTLNEIAEDTIISTEHVRNILHEHLGMEKHCCRYCCHHYTPESKQQSKQ
ncbi:uncharacterized protein LOC117180038 [Belonocnema kinseyi]|uniref:uncharacterized protein LOC117180038 n=1 Tax=Belonocnema kinseyi TaxID=2817044 RepID=UPI00143DCC55|nr:uncharacterized protein LOC117180038 [Belonocnema kinseyi]